LIEFRLTSEKPQRSNIQPALLRIPPYKHDIYFHQISRLNLSHIEAEA